MHNWSIARKLTALIASILVLFIANSALAVYQNTQQNRILAHMISDVLEAERALSQWSNNVNAGVQRAAAIAKSTDASLVAYFEKATQDATANTALQMEIINAKLKDPEQLALLQKASVLRDQYLNLRKEIARLQSQGDLAGADRVFSQQFEPTFKAYIDAVDLLTAKQRERFDALAARSEKGRSESMWHLIIFTSAALALGIGLAFFTGRSITQPLQRASCAARDIASLDLSGQPESSYSTDETGELLRSIDEMRSTLSATMTQVLQASQSISTASEQVAIGSNDLSSRTERTAASLEESASAIEQLSSSAQQCSEATRQAEALSLSSTEATRTGFEKASHVQHTMQEIQRSSQKIGDIIAVIDGIAFQTNILALNAAVEAARAGEQGRGFAVVASEVRTLAQRSATAAKEIRQLINANLGSVSSGTDQVQEAGAAMQRILDNVSRVQDIVAEVNAATHEQSQGAAQVNHSIATLDQMTQQNAALVEESSAAAAHLHAQARELRDVVSKFRLAHQVVAVGGA